MKDYYDVLDLPITATEEQIRARYHQFVRMFHPERYADPFERAYVEKKLKEIHTAYQVLCSPLESAEFDPQVEPPPIPLIEPPVLDFGDLAQGSKRIMEFKVSNVGGQARSVRFISSKSHGWFSITAVKQLKPEQRLPLLFSVTAKPQRAGALNLEESWIEIDMDGVIRRIPMQANFTPPKPLARWPYRLLSVAIICISTFIGSAALHGGWKLLPYWPFHSNPQLAGTDAIWANPQNVSLPARVTSTANTVSATAWAPVYSADHRQVAFISDQTGTPQVFVRDGYSGKLRQLTQSSEPKSTLSWSPNGQKLAFIVESKASTFLEIFDLQANHSYQLIPKTAAGVVKHFVWSTDGSAILFELEENSTLSLWHADLVAYQIEPYQSTNHQDLTWSSTITR